MNVNSPPGIGIVAEYNPFHNGHALHLARARARFLAERVRASAKTISPETVPVVVVLSSSFTQRGLPVLADKWTRTRMALENGVDLVLELPFFYACNAAPEFARGAIDTLAATGFVTHYSYGMENADSHSSDSLRSNIEGTFIEDSSVPTHSHFHSPQLDKILDILIHEPPSFKLDLKKNLASGKSYPKALAEALERELPGGGRFVSAPNNVLALSYLSRVRGKNYDLTPLPVQREGAGYHDGTKGPLASAGAIRRALAGGNSWGGSWLSSAIPASVLVLLQKERKRLCLGTESTERLWTLLRGLLTRSSPEDLRSIAGMDEGLENLFLKHYSQTASYDDFIGRCVCARYTRSRLQRQAARCLLGLDRWTALALSRCSPPYIRVLGYNEWGRALLSRRKNTVSVITRLGAAKGMGAVARLAADLEFRASRLRELLLPRPDLGREERQKPISRDRIEPC
jgi:predicted nucleotidyltransferase